MTVEQPFPSASTAKVSEEELRSFFRNSVAAGSDIGNVDRLDLVVRALARRAHEAAHVGYKPDQEESNDAMDFDLLFSVALPGVVCTGDAAFVRWIRSLNAPEGNLVMTPHELLVWLATDKLPPTSSTGVV